MKALTLLAQTGSTLQKQITLRNMDFLDLRVFLYAYDYNKVYHVKTLEKVDFLDLQEPNDILFKCLDFLLYNTCTPNEAKDIIHTHAKEYGDLIKLIVLKDLRCGVTATLVNKAHPNLIPQFKIQKAKEVPVEDLVYPMICQLKYDGVRLISRIQDGSIRFLSSGGKVAVFAKLAETILDSGLNNCILDGELIYKDGSMQHRGKISGILTSAMRGKVVDESDTYYKVFDVLRLSEFDYQLCEKPYDERYKDISRMAKIIDSLKVQVAETYIVQSSEEVNTLYEDYIARGLEGIILKDPKGKYTYKRTKDWVKVKETKTADLNCVGWDEGEGKYKGMIGSLVCSGIVEGRFITVKVGGMSDIDRGRNPTYFVGSIIEIKYNSVTLDKKTLNFSLFLPRYSIRRDDK